MLMQTPIEPAVPLVPPAAEAAWPLPRGARLLAAAASSPAAHHAVNEDTHSPLDEAGARLFVVADGVGGGAMASLASRTLVATLHARLAQGPAEAEVLERAVLDADREVRATLARHTRAPGAATLALALRDGASAEHWWLAWVGDCRIYLVGRGEDEPARRITRDDTYGELGEIPPPGGSPDDPARMVGNGAVTRPNTLRLALQPGERLLLCSDGVHKHVSPQQIARLLRQPLPLAERCRELVALARAGGSTDDATALAIEHQGARRAFGPAAALSVGAALLAAGALGWQALGPVAPAVEPLPAPAASDAAASAAATVESAAASGALPSFTEPPAPPASGARETAR